MGTREVSGDVRVGLGAPRSAGRLIGGTFALYLRYPWLFIVLAAAVIVPFELISLAVTGSGSLSRGEVGVAAQWTLVLISWTLVNPLVSALHVHAVTEVRDGREPRLGYVAAQGLRALPVVAAASIMSGLGIGVGFLLLIIPGVFLLLRWAVVAQAAAVEREGWLTALRRSGDLTDGHYIHVLVFIFIVGTIAGAPLVVAGFGFGDDNTSAGVFTLGLLLSVLGASFSALGSAVLYYDLVARWNEIPATASGPRGSWDPRAYTDANRPASWYVNPEDPKRMRYWGGPERPEWTGSERTPRRIRREWDEGRG